MGRRQKGSQEGRLNQGAWEQVVERDNIIWEVNWVIPQHRIKNESGLKEALRGKGGKQFRFWDGTSEEFRKN